MHYYFATVVYLNEFGARSKPVPYTIRAKNVYEADDKLREHLGEGIYEINVADPIGYDDEVE